MLGSLVYVPVLPLTVISVLLLARWFEFAVSRGPHICLISCEVSCYLVNTDKKKPTKYTVHRETPIIAFNQTATCFRPAGPLSGCSLPPNEKCSNT